MNDEDKCDYSPLVMLRKPSLLRSPSPLSPRVIPEGNTIEITAATQTPRKESSEIGEVKQKFLSQLDAGIE